MGANSSSGAAGSATVGGYAAPAADGVALRGWGGGREHDDVRHQPRVERVEPARDEVELVLREVDEERAHGPGREEVQVCRIVLRLPPEQEAEPVLQAKAVRDGADQ